MKNLGGYEKLFPIEIPKGLAQSEDEADQEKYKKIIQQKDMYETVRAYAKDLFDNQFGVRTVKKEIEKPETPNMI